MKRFSKILCAVLMLALICTSVAFLVGADSTTPDTVVQTVNGNELASVAWGDIEGNMLPKGANWVQYKQKDTAGNETDDTMLDAYVVTPADGDGYAVLWAGEHQDGGSFQNLQHSYLQYNENMVALTNDSYYVVDLDIATASETITNIEISLCNRNASGGEFPFGQNVIISQYVDLDSEWVHFTVVNSIKTNKQYIFVNGKFVGEGQYAYNTTVTGAKTPEEYGLHAQGIKIEVPYGLSNGVVQQNIYANQSIAFDNVSRRNYTDAEGIAALDAIINSEEKDLTQWAGYPENVRTGSLPVYVEIDGVEYNNIGEANKVLVGNEAKTVNVLNSFPGALYVSCDATINMNGYTGNVWSNGTVSPEVDGVITVDAPYSASQIDKHNSSTSDIKNAALSSLEGGVDFKFTFNYMNGLSQDGATPGLYSYVSEANGNKFISVLGNPQVNDKSNTYFEIQIMKEITYNGGAAQFFVFDMDVALLSNDTFPLMTVQRDGTNTGMWGAENPPINTIVTEGIGEFQHLTIVVDIANNDLYVYSNNVSSYYTAVNGFTSDANHANFKTAAKWNFNGLRLGSNSKSSVSIDNVYARHLTGDAAVALQTALAGGGITAWDGNVYGEDYVLPKLGAAVSIDGVEYPSAAAASAALSGNDVKNVVIMREFADTLTVSCNAVIETNGFDVDIAYGAGVTHEQVGTVITTVAPYQLSAEYTLQNGGSLGGGDGLEWNLDNASATAIKNAVLGSVSGGIAPSGLSMAKVNDFHNYVVTAAGDSNPFVLVDALGTITKDMQFTQVFTETNLSSGTNYYVIDVDMATDSFVDNNMYLCPVLRFADGTGGTPFGYSVPLHHYIEADGTWKHLTIIGDMADNELYIFVDGVRKATWTAYNDYQDFGGGLYGTATNLKFQSVKISNHMGTEYGGIDDNSSLYVDNLTVRIYNDNTAAGDVEAAIAASSIAGWSNKVDGRGGSNLPKVATIDGVDYFSTASASAALVGDGISSLIIDREIFGSQIVIDKSASVQFNGLDTKLVKANAQPVVLNTAVGERILGSNFYIDGSNYTKITAENFAANSGNLVMVTWVDADDIDYEEIYYPVGSKITYIGSAIELPATNYIENGKLYGYHWEDYYDSDLILPDELIASKDEDTYSYEFIIVIDETETDITVSKDLAYNMTLYSNFDVNLYVPVANGVSGSVTIDGVQYAVYTKSIAANNISSDLVYIIEFVVDGVTYTEKIVVNVLNYAEAVLESQYSDAMKRVIMSALDYANEAYGLVNGGADNAAISAILANEAYAEYKVEDDTNYGEVNTDELKSVITDAKLIVGSDVKIVLVLADGYEGDVSITYTDYKGQADRVLEVEKVGNELIIQPKVYNLACDLDIVAGELTGTYNLGGYIRTLIESGSEQADFATALFTYAKVAEAYKTALNNA